MKDNRLFPQDFWCRILRISGRLLIAMLLGGALLFGGCDGRSGDGRGSAKSSAGDSLPPALPPPPGDDLQKKHLQLAESALDCLDEMIGQLQGINSHESLQSTLPGFRAAVDRFSEIAKEGMRLEREEGEAKFDPETDQRLNARMKEKMEALRKEIDRMKSVPGVDLNDLMAIAQSFQSLLSLIPGGNVALPPTGIAGSSGPVAPPSGFGGQGSPVPTPPGFGGPGGPVPTPPGFGGPGGPPPMPPGFGGPGGPPPMPPGFGGPAAPPPPHVKPPENVNPPKMPQGPDSRSSSREDFRQDLENLRSDSFFDRQRALERLVKAKPEDVKSKDLHKQIAQAIKNIAFNTQESCSLRPLAIEGMVVWGGKYSVPLLIQLLDDDSIPVPYQKILYQKLAELKDERAIEPVVKQFYDNVFLSDDALNCLEVFGAKAEDALLQRFPPQSPFMIKKALKFLGKHGTKKSLPKVRALRDESFALALEPELGQALDALSQRAQSGK